VGAYGTPPNPSINLRQPFRGERKGAERGKAGKGEGKNRRKEREENTPQINSCLRPRSLMLEGVIDVSVEHRSPDKLFQSFFLDCVVFFPHACNAV